MLYTPDRSIGAGETLRKIQRVDLIDDWKTGLKQILAVLNKKYFETILTEHLKFIHAIKSLGRERDEFPSLSLAFDNTDVMIEMPCVQGRILPRVLWGI